jgi:type II secretory pathway predicted ATPase ExeA
LSGAARTLPEEYGDPFGATADPSRYVPREATERALVELERALLDQESPALLVGLPGIGKTLLLRLLRRRLEARLEVIHLPYAALPPAALANWALNEMKVPSSWDPVGALAIRARNAHLEGRGGIVLLIDDAEVLPEETARALMDMVRDAEGGLRFVAAVDEGAADRLDGWLGDVAWVRLVAPMNADETTQYVHARLQASDLPERAFAAFGPDVLADLYVRSGGIPGRVGAEASALLLRVLRPSTATAVAPSGQVPLDAPDGVLESLVPGATPPPDAEPAAQGSSPLVTPPQPSATPPPAPEPDPDAALPSVPAPEPEASPTCDSDASPEPGASLPRDPETSPAPEEPRPPVPEPEAPRPVVPEPEAAPLSRSEGAVPAEADDPDAALERAAGRLALTHSGVASPDVSPSLERAAGRLALARETVPDARALPQPAVSASGRWPLSRKLAVAAGVRIRGRGGFELEGAFRSGGPLAHDVRRQARAGVRRTTAAARAHSRAGQRHPLGAGLRGWGRSRCDAAGRLTARARAAPVRGRVSRRDAGRTRRGDQREQSLGGIPVSERSGDRPHGLPLPARTGGLERAIPRAMRAGG